MTAKFIMSPKNCKLQNISKFVNNAELYIRNTTSVVKHARTVVPSPVQRRKLTRDRAPNAAWYIVMSGVLNTTSVLYAVAFA